jgi:diguanylate cyclase (GGDEF)-like protein/putative nucleotidyltransferase with HDIG domain
LYLSTIETLAMAIDAKDQITHGHIRRVQSYAVALAGRLGVTDPSLIKAIEAAALLHDMGKLAVPEYILNKPGKLTSAEFEKMKLHATVGADILSAIEFPYPVVPIVRHHHENWDGTGYPAGLKNTDIPIGARILSVVDCFDALTSDRPYRPRLSDDEALKILAERRGNMYDPLIVDTFVRVHKEIAPQPVATTLSRDTLREITELSAVPLASGKQTQLEGITASADEVVTLFELARGMSGATTVGAGGEVLGKHLRRLIPFAQSALFLYDAATDELVAQYASGDASPLIKGLRVSLGQRLSGWVAANRQIIVNSDPALDLGEAARTLEPRLRSALSVPLIAENELVGVLTLYATAHEAFTEEHRRIAGSVARQVGPAFRSMGEFEHSAKRDTVTGLPNLKQLERIVDAASGGNVAAHARITLLLIDVVHLDAINAQYGRMLGDETLRFVVKHARAGLRAADILFRYGNDEFVALLNDVSLEAAKAIAVQISQSIRGSALKSESGDRVVVDVRVTPLVAESGSVGEHLATARDEMHAGSTRGQVSTVH